MRLPLSTTLIASLGAHIIAQPLEVDASTLAPVKRALPTTVATASQYVAYVKTIYGLAIDYSKLNIANPNSLVANYLRHLEYNDAGFNVLVGFLDNAFIKKVDDAGVKFFQFVVDPKSKLQVKPSHFAACLDGYFNNGNIATPETNGADIGGWGGDLLSFYGDWRFEVQGKRALPKQKRASSPSATSYVQSSGLNNVETSFKLRDLIEDADCYNTYKAIQRGSNIATEIESIFLKGGANDRIRRFYLNKFGSREVVENTAKDVLTQSADPLEVVLNEGKKSVIQGKAGKGTVLPDNLPPSELAEFTKAFAQKFNDIAASAAQAI